MRLFAKLSLDLAISDRTTIMNSRHLLVLHNNWYANSLTPSAVICLRFVELFC
ncbi:TPA: hypothetical protein SIA35_004326 [Aeromonas sobria]|nr:hypothetical protein [Aeromonas sobria]